MATTLTYTRLNEAGDEFRLLTIIPSQDEDAPVACSLEVHALTNPPAFHALSYVWGDPTDTVDIIINDTIFRATRNLENVLRAMRTRLADPEDVILLSLVSPSDSSGRRKSLAHRDGAYRIWADAVCINQSDAVERDAQVLRMRDIYTASIATVAWLGQPAERSEVAFGLVRTLAARDKHKQYKVVTDTNQRGYEYLWVALAKLLEREYWTRCWVLQELVLAQHAWLLCGSDYTDLKTFSYALYGAGFRHEYVLEQLGYLDRDKILQKTVMVKTYMKLRVKRQMAELKRERATQETSEASERTEDHAEVNEYDRERKNLFLKHQTFVSLPYLIGEKTRARLQSTVLHDQIYSLLGLCDEPTTLIPEPSYQKPYRLVMKDMYQRMAETSNSLDWIRLSGGNEPLDVESCLIENREALNLNKLDNGGVLCEQEHRRAHYKKISEERLSGLWPSWVPDNLKFFGSMVHGNTVVEGCMYEATKEVLAKVSFKEGVLSCRGLIFDTIQSPTYSSLPMHATQFGVHPPGSSIDLPNPYGGVEATYEAIWLAATENTGLERLTETHPCDSAWVFAEYWHNKWAGVNVQSLPPVIPSGLAAAHPEHGMICGQASPDWPHESLYLPFSTLGPDEFDANTCARRWGLLHDQKDMLIHGLPLREWMRRRTMLESLVCKIPPNEQGVNEHLRHKCEEGNSKPFLKRLTKLKDIGTRGTIMSLWPTFWRKLQHAKAFATPNELFVTNRGYVGSRFKFCSKKPGDKIALIFGCNTPVILRPRPEGEGYTFVTGAYVHGIMNGEACKDLDPNEVQWIDIH